MQQKKPITAWQINRKSCQEASFLFLDRIKVYHSFNQATQKNLFKDPGKKTTDKEHYQKILN
jgi:hypothetical protein